MLFSKKINSVRSESLDTGHMSLPQSSGRSSISNQEDQDKVLSSERRQSLQTHKKVVSYSCLTSELLYGDSFEVSSVSSFKGASLSLRNLDKLVKLKLLSRFSRWKTNQTPTKAQKLFTMISKLQQLFTGRAKRVFHPPRVIKDADEIMTRTIKKIIQIKQRLLESAVIRWKFFTLALYTKEKAVVFFKACQLAGHSFKDAFFKWKFKVFALEAVKRTAGTEKTARVLNKAFRARFKLFVFQTYLKMSPKKAALIFAALLLKKAQENKRLAFKTFSAFLEVLRKKHAQRRADRKIFKMVACWQKVLKLALTRGWKKMTPGRVGLACRLVFRRALMKRNWFWQEFKKISWNKKVRLEGLRIQGALMRVIRKRQKVGFRVFQRVEIPSCYFYVFKTLFKNVLRAAFTDIQIFLNRSKVDEIKEATKFIRKNNRKNVLRSVKLTGKTMKSCLKNLLMRFFQLIIRASALKRSQQLSFKLTSKYLLKKHRTIFSQWKKVTRNTTQEKLQKSLNGQKLLVILMSIPRKTLKSCYSLLFERKAQVVVATRVFTRQLGKKPKSVLNRWHKTIESINQGLLFDACRSQKLKDKLLKLIQPCMKTFFSRITSDPLKFLPTFRNLYKISLQRVKNGFKNWFLIVKDCKSKQVVSSLRAVSLKNSFNSLLSLKFSTFFSDLVKNDQKSKKCLRRLFLIFNKNLSKVLKNWENLSFLAKKKSAVYKIYLKLLNEKLIQVIQRNFRSYFKSFLAQPQTKLVRILGVYLFKLQDIPRQVFNVWRFFVLACKTKLILDNKRCEKIRQKLSKIIQIPLRNALFRIFGSGRLVKGCFFRMNSLFSNRFRRLFDRWKTFSYLCARQRLLDAFRSQKLKTTMRSLVNRVTFPAFHRVKGAGNLIKSVLKSMSSANEQKLQHSFKLWKHFSELIRYKSSLMFSLVSVKLKSRLVHLLSLRCHLYFNHLLSRSDLKVKNSIKTFIYFFSSMMKESLFEWKKKNNEIKKQLLQRRSDGTKIKRLLKKLTVRVSRGYFGRVSRAGLQVREKIIKNFYLGLKFLLNQWKRNIYTIYNIKNSQEKKALKLNFAFRNVLNRISKEVIRKLSKYHGKNILKLALKTQTSNFRKVFNRWKIFGLQNFQKSQIFIFQRKICGLILRNAIEKVLHLRIAKVFKQRFLIRTKIEKVFNTLNFSICKTLRSRFQHWSKKVPTSKYKELRTRKLLSFLKKSLFRSNEHTFETISGTILKSSSLSQSIKVHANQINSSKLNLNETRKTLRSKSLLSSLQGVCFQFKLSSMVRKEHRSTFSSILQTSINSKTPPLRKFCILWLHHYKNTLSSSLSCWSSFVKNCQKCTLLDGCRSLNLRHHLEQLPKRLTRDAFNRIIGQGNKVKGHLKSFIFHIQKSLNFGFAAWKTWLFNQKLSEVWLRFRGTSLRSVLKQMTNRHLRPALERIFGNGKRVVGQMMRFLSHFKYKYLLCFNSWKEKVLKLKQRDSLRASKLLIFFSKTSQKVLKILLEGITGNTKIRKSLKKLVFSFKMVQKHVLHVLRSRVEKLKTIKKISSSFIILKHIQSYLKKVLNSQFLFWKNLEFLRRRRILRKSIGKMIQNMSINFESGLWKWKFVLTRCGKQLNPRHSIFFKRLLTIASSYQTRLEQFALFKLVLNYKTQQLNHRVTLPKAIAQLIKDSESDRSEPKDLPRRLVPDDKIIQLGALEILFLRLDSAKVRRLSWVLSALHSNFRYFDSFEREREYFKEKIAEVRYERQSLLEDNNTLRLHNDNLISSLEQNTEDLQEISLSMDYLKISSMVKAIERVFDYNLLTSFYKLNF